MQNDEIYLIVIRDSMSLSILNQYSTNNSTRNVNLGFCELVLIAPLTNY